MNKKRVSLFASAFLIVLVTTATALYMTNSGIAPFPKASIAAYAAGTPDALNNRITSISFQQNATGSWAQVAILYASSYVLNYNLTIPANQHTIVYCVVSLNYTLAPDASTAMARVRVYLTISGVVTSASMIPSTAVLIPYDCWQVTLGYPSISTPPTSTWIPSTDTTYTITYQYQAYY